MKEASGEANMTVITIVLIAIVLAVGTVVVNSVMKNSAKSSACQTAGGFWENGRCAKTKGGNTYLTCTEASQSGNYSQGVGYVEKGEWYCY